jgi:D-alanine-D-alanine ligase
MLGGPSAEREVSLKSGAAVEGALHRCGYRVTLVDPVRPDWELPPGVVAAFLALHGTYGEDGTVQGELERREVPYTGCDAEASRIAFDKLLTKQRCESVGVPTPSYFLVNDPDGIWPEEWRTPVVVKPVRQGSSVGLNIVEDLSNYRMAVQQALQHDRQVLVETLIRGRELTVGILGNSALPIVEIRPRVGPYDYQNKYTPGATQYACPAELPRETASRVQDVALRAFQAVGGRDYGRVDVMLDGGNQPWVLEVNTLPGMTETSLFPKAAAAIGLSFDELCDTMMRSALGRAGRLVI